MSRVGPRHCAWVGVLVSLAPLAARAQSDRPHHTAHLLYHLDRGAERCPDETTVRGDITSRLGYDPFADDGAPLTISIAREGRSLRATLRFGDTPRPRAPRTIRSRTQHCDDLAHAVVLAAAIAIDPLVALRPPPPPSSPPPSSEPPASSSSPAIEPVASASPSPSPSPPPVEIASAAPSITAPVAHTDARTGWLLTAALTLSSGFTPSIAPGVQLGLAHRWNYFVVGIEARVSLPNSAAAFTGNVSVLPVVAALSACGIAPWRIAPFGCALVQAGWLFGQGQGFSGGNQSAVVGPLLGLGGRIGVLASMTSRLVLIATFDATGFPVAASFVVTGASTPAWTSPSFSLGGSLGAGLSFW